MLGEWGKGDAIVFMPRGSQVVEEDGQAYPALIKAEFILYS